MWRKGRGLMREPEALVGSLYPVSGSAWAGGSGSAHRAPTGPPLCLRGWPARLGWLRPGLARCGPGEMFYINVNFPPSPPLAHSTSYQCGAVSPIFHTLCLCSLSGAIPLPGAVVGQQLEKFSCVDTDRPTQQAHAGGAPGPSPLPFSRVWALGRRGWEDREGKVLHLGSSLPFTPLGH